MDNHTSGTSTTGKSSPLHDFLAPDSIAIIGASQDPTKRGYKAILGLIKGHYRGRLYPVNPRVSDILGIPTCASLDDVPGPVDLAIGVRRRRVCRRSCSIARAKG